MEQLPPDLYYLLAIYLDYDSVRKYCQIFRKFSPVCRDPNFWRDKAIYDIGMDDQDWKEVVKETGDAQEAYVRLAAENNIPFWGAEKYGNIDNLTEAAAKFDNLPLLQYFYSISQNPKALDILASRNKVDFIRQLFPENNETNNVNIFQGALSGGFLQLANQYIPQNISEDTLPQAVTSGKLEVVNFTINLIKKQIDQQVEDGSIDKIEEDDLFISYLDNGLEKAVEHNYSDIIDLLINRGAKDLELAIFAAAINGDKKMITKLISQINSDDEYWFLGLTGAARGGHKELIDYFIGLGANNYNHGMAQAAAGGQLNIIDYMISKGANKFDEALDYAIRFDRLTSTKYLLSKLPDAVIERTVTRNIPAIVNLDNLKMYKLLHRWIRLGPEDLRHVIIEGRGKILREVLKTSPPNIIPDLINLTNKHLNVIIQLIDYQIKQAKEFKTGAFRYQLSQLYG